VARLGREYYEVPEEYVRSVIRAGGVPVLVAQTAPGAAADRLLDGLDGLLFSGSADLDPRRYGERRHPRATRLHPDKEASDVRLIRKALARDMPILGVCGGLQLLNVALGGSLIQDIPSQIRGALPHRADREAPRADHAVLIRPGSLLRRILRVRRLGVNSSHHQAVHALGRGLRECARSRDGLVEAVESAAHRFALGVQWHPERLGRRRLHRRLFGALVRAASRRHGRRED
jgi:putative glutamine amidotransferase